MANDVFISYRRTVSSDSSGRLYSALQKKMRKTNIFFDVNSIPPGEDFFKQIEDNIRTVKVMLVIIDPNWVGLTNNEGNRRLDSPKDYVRHEIETAFKCHVAVIPVLVGNASMPKEGELPESLHKLCRCNEYSIRYEHYDADINELSKAINNNLPSRICSIYDTFVDSEVSNLLIAYTTLTALLLFFGVMGLKLHDLYYPINIHTNFAGDSIRSREVGLLLAVNWTLFMCFITPWLIFLFHSVMHDAKSLLTEFELNKMIVYISASGEEDRLPAISIWNSVLKKSSYWFLMFLLIALVLGIANWFAYSGGFYLYGDKPEEIAKYLYESTGVDWNVGWIISKELIPGGVVIFTLAMYLLYGIGWWVTFSFYIFLFNFFSEIQSVTGATKVYKNNKLCLNLKDGENGGFGRFNKIQRHHSSFCVLSIISMFLMSFRNTYLQNTCNVPVHEVVLKINGKDELLNRCDNMVGFAGRLVESLTAIYYSPADILNILFFSYAKAQNPFVYGSFLQVGVIAGFFYFITMKMERIIEEARHASDDKVVASSLLKHLKHQNVITLIFLITGGIAIIFLNFVVVPLIILIVLLVSNYMKYKYPAKSS